MSKENLIKRNIYFREESWELIQTLTRCLGKSPSEMINDNIEEIYEAIRKNTQARVSTCNGEKLR